MLHSGAQTIGDMLEQAKNSEAAHSANAAQTDQVEKLTARLETLIDQLSTKTTTTPTDQTSSAKKVTFTQSSISDDIQQRRTYNRSYSPSSRSVSPVDNNRSERQMNRSSSRSPVRYQSYNNRQQSTSSNGRPYNFTRDSRAPTQQQSQWKSPV